MIELRMSLSSVKYFILSSLVLLQCNVNGHGGGGCPSGMCRSKWGFCGTGSAYCGTSGCSSGMCRSKWGFCGTGREYCGSGCQAGPCTDNDFDNNGNEGGSIGAIDKNAFACVFNTIDAEKRHDRFNGLKATGWKPTNKEEAAVFLAHVFHETDGLKTLQEYCAPGCGSQYAGSWCEIHGNPAKSYYGRGWFQLAWPCNYYRAGQALGVDLLNNPDKVETQPDLAAKTALWYYKEHNMAGPAQQGDFAATTRIINGKLECNHGSGYNKQLSRVATYKRIRQCFGLGEPHKNPVC